MSFSKFLKPLGFKRNWSRCESVDFKGFLEGDFGPVFKNAEKRYCIGSTRLSPGSPVARWKPEFRRPGNQQIGMTR